MNRITEVPNSEINDKLSTILESTRECVSSGSNSGTYTKTAGLTFAIAREDIVPIKEQPRDRSMYSILITIQ